jgi:hypothetical protein
MVQVINRAGFRFISVSDQLVEIYHPKASYADQPFEVVRLNDANNESTLRRLANETSEYTRI